MKKMNAIVLAAGLGTRLRPLTDNCPKALVPVDGIPMLQHLLLKLRRSGIGRVAVNLHYLGDQIADFLRANDNFGLQIALSDERGQLLDTGGGIARALTLLDDDAPVLIHNVDVFSTLDIAHMQQSALLSGSDALLLTQERASSRLLAFDSALRLTGWRNVKSGEVKRVPGTLPADDSHTLAFNGVHLLSPALAARLRSRAGEAFPLIPFYLQAAEHFKICAYCPPAPFEWVDAGKPAELPTAARIAAMERDF